VLWTEDQGTVEDQRSSRHVDLVRPEELRGIVGSAKEEGSLVERKLTGSDMLEREQGLGADIVVTALVASAMRVAFGSKKWIEQVTANLMYPCRPSNATAILSLLRYTAWSTRQRFLANKLTITSL
jgi:hypothetical protein